MLFCELQRCGYLDFLKKKIFITLLLHCSHISYKITNMYSNSDGPNIVYVSTLSSPVSLVIEAYSLGRMVCLEI